MYGPLPPWRALRSPRAVDTATCFNHNQTPSFWRQPPRSCTPGVHSEQRRTGWVLECPANAVAASCPAMGVTRGRATHPNNRNRTLLLAYGAACAVPLHVHRYHLCEESEKFKILRYQDPFLVSPNTSLLTRTLASMDHLAFYFLFALRYAS